MDARIVGRLQHNACLGSVHLIYTQRSIASSLGVATLFLHSIGHEESLVWFLSSKPKIE